MKENLEEIKDIQEEKEVFETQENDKKEVVKLDDELTQNKVNEEDEDEEDEEDESSEDKFYSILREIRSYTFIVLAAIIIAIVVNSFVLSNTRIPTGSMENTIMCGNRLFGNRLAYVFSDVKRGDIIIFKYPDDPNINYIKRVIGLPGDTVTVINGQVSVNGEVITEDYLKEPMQGTFGPYEVPEDSYFVMGDNRNNSNDARFWTNTYVHKDTIIAKAMVRYWPSFKIIK